ncbi:MAG TPA: DoxX family protein [Thermoanaerobaculia bacterium]|jgi:uncharacterized membrane protein YphA (DoxX/SURF4 family)
MRRREIAREVVVWLITILMVLMFGAAGLRKFSEHSGWTVMFHNLGFPDWFRILIGAIETAAALLLLYPRTAAYGAMANVAVMIGAIASVSMHGWTHSLPQPTVALVLSAIILAARWRQRVRLSQWIMSRASSSSP